MNLRNHEVVRKIKDPVWRKPDWAFVEEGKPIPPASSPLREERKRIFRRHGQVEILSSVACKQQ